MLLRKKGAFDKGCTHHFISILPDLLTYAQRVLPFIQTFLTLWVAFFSSSVLNTCPLHLSVWSSPRGEATFTDIDIPARVVLDRDVVACWFFDADLVDLVGLVICEGDLLEVLLQVRAIQFEIKYMMAP
jgi:hypothetical protein